MSDLLSIIAPFTLCLWVGAHSFYIVVVSFKYFFNKKNIKELELENEIHHLQNKLKEVSLIIDDPENMHTKIAKIEKLILQESYKTNNVININNFRKFKK